MNISPRTTLRLLGVLPLIFFVAQAVHYWPVKERWSLVVWVVCVVLAWGVCLSSTLGHVGGLTVGLVALSQVGMDRTAWRWAFGWYLVIQLLSRFLTSPALNVNLAHAVQPGWDRTFHSYWEFWLVLND